MDNWFFQSCMKMVNSSSDTNRDSAYGGPFASLTTTICALKTVVN